MDYLSKFEFTPEEIDQAKTKVGEEVLTEINKREKLVSKNIAFLKDLGVKNYKEIFINYPQYFLRDHSLFKNTFLQYDREDLIEKLKKNISILVRL